MIGTKFYKNAWTDQTAKQYAAAAEWCNANMGRIEDKGDCYEVVAIPEPTLEELKTAKRAEVWGAGDAILAAVKRDYTQAEIESWSKQEQGAKDLAAGETDSEAAQFVAGIATLRGIPVDTLRDKILANVAAYGQLCTAVIGTQQRLDDLIKAAQSAEDVAAVTWPETLG